MKRLLALGIFLSLVIAPAKVSAVPFIDEDPNNPIETFQLPGLDLTKPVNPTPIKHKIKPNETLTKIAKQHSSTVERLWAKNTELKNPDILKINQEIIIPTKDEKLKERKMPIRESPAAVVNRRPAIPGNTYAPCNCTFYAKSKRPDLPNSLGNADLWYGRAQAQGIPTGHSPRVGAIGMFKSYMHVAYVEQIKKDEVLVSEWNFSGLCVLTKRWVPASTLLYIY